MSILSHSGLLWLGSQHRPSEPRRRLGVALALGLVATSQAGTAGPPEELGRLEDPTRPYGYGVEAAPAAPLPEGGWRLSFVRTGMDGAIAIVNDQTVRVGDRLGSAEVTAIRDGVVVLQEGGRTVEVWFDGSGGPRR